MSGYIRLFRSGSSRKKLGKWKLRYGFPENCGVVPFHTMTGCPATTSTLWTGNVLTPLRLPEKEGYPPSWTVPGKMAKTVVASTTYVDDTSVPPATGRCEHLRPLPSERDFSPPEKLVRGGTGAALDPPTSCCVGRNGN